MSRTGARRSNRLGWWAHLDTDTLAILALAAVMTIMALGNGWYAWRLMARVDGLERRTTELAGVNFQIPEIWRQEVLQTVRDTAEHMNAFIAARQDVAPRDVLDAVKESSVRRDAELATLHAQLTHIQRQLERKGAR